MTGRRCRTAECILAYACSTADGVVGLVVCPGTGSTRNSSRWYQPARLLRQEEQAALLVISWPATVFSVSSHQPRSGWMVGAVRPGYGSSCSSGRACKAEAACASGRPMLHLPVRSGDLPVNGSPGTEHRSARSSACPGSWSHVDRGSCRSPRRPEHAPKGMARVSRRGSQSRSG